MDQEIIEVEQTPSQEIEEKQPEQPPKIEELTKLQEQTIMRDLISNLLKVSNNLQIFREFNEKMVKRKVASEVYQQAFVHVIFENQDNKQSFIRNLKYIIEDILENIKYQMIKELFRFLINKQDQLLLDVDLYYEQKIDRLWRKLYPKEISQFIIIFKLENYIQQRDIADYFYRSIDTKKFDIALELFQEFPLPLSDFETLINRMIQAYEGSKAAKFVKLMKFDLVQFPKLVQNLQESTAKYIFKTYPWYQCEEMLEKKPQILAIVCEKFLQNNGQIWEAASIVQRNNLQHMFRQQTQLKFETALQNAGQQLAENILVSRDFFGPIDDVLDQEKQYLKTTDLGQLQNQVQFISQDDDALEQSIKAVLSAKIVGFDTEFITQYSATDEDSLQIIQISTYEQSYIYDVVSLKKTVKFIEFVNSLMTIPTLQIVGHTVSQDINKLCQGVQIEPQNNPRVIDISLLYQTATKEKQRRGLAYISEHYFKKPLSKSYQCSDWSRRPLRKAQLHYAALDSLICLHIYDKLNSEQQMINH